MKTPVALLVRVSTLKQETDRQVSELSAYAAENSYEIIDICEEKVSGKASQKDREGLKRVVELAREGRIKKVLVHEVSRIARRNSIAHSFLESLEAHKVSLYWHSQRIETLLEDGSRNPAASIMFSMLAELGRAEVESLSLRVKSGLAEARRKGRTLGRPKGSGISDTELLDKHTDVIKLLNKGISIRNIAAIVQKIPTTVQKVRSALKAA